MLTRIKILSLIMCMALNINDVMAADLTEIIERGEIIVGTTGDYRPFSYYDPVTGEYGGYDIEAAKILAKSMGVGLKFVRTSWPTLMQDLEDQKFDIAMTGITRTLGRQKVAAFSDPYIKFGKVILVRKQDLHKYTDLKSIDIKGVKIGVNPGGTNYQFVSENIKNATVIVIEKNAEIPAMVSAGTIDAMITDSIEAIIYAKADSVLAVSMLDKPLTTSQLGYLMHQDSNKLLSFVNMWMAEAELCGEFDKLHVKWM